ncbi:Helix-turn-helix domain-containing protein [Parafrankia irregularis]|uniref:Helix-turn-helix domain-containing protein n=1 Tax=Parafrankia irregularis TaxID=795642 RepID=A0A0S4QV66_9ACTN|nr:MULTISPECIES: helix-turn-helix domain-containing protein [Parafrankia]MBE3205276.1 helix-turn-helix domain-containing protein [Parafrankia sp. CH37]CUU58764.1 Helix-turn-helix domain-containing protein [Parafrankia irregularis]
MNKPSQRVEQDELRTRMRATGMSHHEIAIEFARRYRLRPRAAYRVAHGWTQQQAADRINAHATRAGLDPEGTAPMTAPRLSEVENWPRPARRRPTPQLLALLAEVYGCDLHALVDVDDREHLPPADVFLINGMSRPPDRAATSSAASSFTSSAPLWGTATERPVEAAPSAASAGHAPNPSSAGQTHEDHLIIFPQLAPDGRIVLMPLDRRGFLSGLGLTAASGSTLSPLAMTPTIPSGSSSIDPRVVDHFARLRAVLAENDNLFGPRQVITTAQEQAGLIATHLRNGTNSRPQRQTLLHIQTQFADLLGWLHQDSGDHATAGYWLDRALEWSHRAGDPKATVFILARKSQLAADRGDPVEAVDVADAALTSAEPTGRLAAIAATYSAHGHALRGEKTTCLTLYDRAHDILDRAGPDTDPWGEFFSPAYIEVQRAHSLAALGDYPAAASGFRTAIDGLPPAFHRDRGVYLAREALAHAGAREPEQAATLGLNALTVGASTHSGRIMTSLRTLRDAVAGWQTVPQVREFRQAMDRVPTAIAV